MSGSPTSSAAAPTRSASSPIRSGWRLRRHLEPARRQAARTPTAPSWSAPFDSSTATSPVVAGQTLQGVPDIGLLLLTTRDGRRSMSATWPMSWSARPQPDQRVWTLSRDGRRAARARCRPSPSPSPSARAPTRSWSPTSCSRGSKTVEGRLVPDDVAVTVTRDYGATANDKANELLFHSALATVSIVVLITLAIGWREGVVVAHRHPDHHPADALRLVADGLHHQPGQPVRADLLDRHPGRRRHRRDREHRPPLACARRKDWSQTAIEAVAEVGNPTIVATLTIIAALLPMMFVSGLMGPYMSPIPANASVAMLFSFFVAVMITPWLLLPLRAPALRGPRTADAPPSTRSARWAGFYLRVARPLLTGAPAREDLSRWRSASRPLGVCALFATKDVTVKLLPFDNKSELQVVVDLPQGTTLEDTERLLRPRPSALKDLPELTSIQAYAGTAAPFNFNGLVRHYYLRSKPEQGDLQVDLVAKGDRSRASHAIALDMRQRLAELAAAARHGRQGGRGAAGPAGAGDLAGRDLRPRRRDAARGARQGRRGLRAASISSSTSTTPSTARARGCASPSTRRTSNSTASSEQAVYDTIAALIGGVKVGYSHRGDGTKPIEIDVGLPKRARMAWASASCRRPFPAGGTRRPGRQRRARRRRHGRRASRAPTRIFRRDGHFDRDGRGRGRRPLTRRRSTACSPSQDQIKQDGLGQRPARRTIRLPRPAARRIASDAAVGRRVGGDLCHLPRHGRRLRRGDPRHLSPGRRAVRLVPPAAGDPRRRCR